MTTSLTMIGVEWMPISPVSRSICSPLPFTTPTFRSTMPFLAERGDDGAGLRVERDEAVAGRHVEDALVALAVGPVRHAAARELARRDRGALALAQAVRPDQLAGLARRAR